MYWTGHDLERADRMFRQSGLMREKWLERHGNQTYGAMTLEKAYNSTPRYTPPVSASKPAKAIDWKYNPANYKPDEEPAVKEPEVEQGEPEESQSNISVFTYLQNYLYSDIERTKQYKNRKTGYSNIDRYVSLMPGLYVVGSLTGGGKTTFCGQMADYLASQGEHVLYFSLEQTRFELVSKGLSRLTALEVMQKYGHDALTKFDTAGAVTASSIRLGYTPEIVQTAIEQYKAISHTLRIIEGGFNTDVQAIVDTVLWHIQKTGVKPVVFVDYLQIVQPPKTMQKATRREGVDSVIRQLKTLSKDNDLTVFVISSLNRQNYLSLIDFESFKESGDVEYSSDCVWGLQLLAMNAAIFNKDSELQVKRKFVSEALNESPRKMELLGLKTRYGRARTRYFFDYFSQFDLFLPYEAEIEEVEESMSEKFLTFKLRYENEKVQKSKGGNKAKDLGR